MFSHDSIIEGRIVVPSAAIDRVQFARDGLERLAIAHLNVNLDWEGDCLRFEGRTWEERFRLCCRDWWKDLLCFKIQRRIYPLF